MADDEIADLKLQMEQACRDDNTAREHGQPAVNKLKMLPAVLNVLTRNTMRHTIVDPETNFLLSAKFFLEPLNDGSLPAYNIQRDLLTALERLPIDKECLLSSGIGKVVLYYTKSKRPEIGIKRIAERLLADWSRPILKRSDDYKKRKIATIDYDSRYVSSLLVLLSTTNTDIPQPSIPRPPSKHPRDPRRPTNVPARNGARTYPLPAIALEPCSYGFTLGFLQRRTENEYGHRGGWDWDTDWAAGQ